MLGDDGVGQEVAEALWLQRAEVPELADATFQWAQQLAPEMALDLSRASFVVFVDAACDGRPAGSVTVQRLSLPDDGQPVAVRAGASGCWQDLRPASLLALSAWLYGYAPPAVLVTVSVGSMEAGSELSPEVRAAIPWAATAARFAMAGAAHA